MVFYLFLGVYDRGYVSYCISFRCAGLSLVSFHGLPPFEIAFASYLCREECRVDAKYRIRITV